MKTLSTETLSTQTLSIKTKYLKNASMKKSALACIVISSLITTPVMASDDFHLSVEQKIQKKQANKKEEVGFGTGAIIGAIIAGPFGAVFAGIAGSLIAKHSNVIDERDNLTSALSEEKNDHQLALQNYQEKLQSAEQEYQSELLALQQSHHNTSQLQAENLLMSLQFTTGSSELKPHYQGQILALAKMLEQSPNLSIDLSGYTDLQGDEILNHKLSIARVNSVKHALINRGVGSDRIKLFAYGEQSPVVASNQKEASFYDRRVVIKLRSEEGQVAKNY
ncbi:MAG: sortase-associated OmpA-like protein PdsO [Colwellia sp.]|nr:sortase-associated OmpA-like protein PdsO [Colwellia sp.]